MVSWIWVVISLAIGVWIGYTMDNNRYIPPN